MTTRAFFTINNPTFKDSETLYALGHSDLCKYLIYGAEHVDAGTPHFQGFVIFTRQVRKQNVCGKLGGRAAVFFPKKNDPSLRMARYCKKEGFYMEFGNMGGGVVADSSIKPSEMRQKAIEFFNKWEEHMYMREKDLPGDLLMTPGFLNSWNKKRSVTLGPDRPELKIITLIGPTACGKSFAVHNLFPDHAKCFYGNSGVWFANPDAPVLLFEEFNGQIPLQKMLALLDHYKMQLEVKGGFCPALYTTVCITSNVTPDHWYGNMIVDAKKMQECQQLGISLDEAQKRWNQAKAALYDRLGFRTNRRGCGFYGEWCIPDGYDERECLIQIRSEIWDAVYQIANPPALNPIDEIEPQFTPPVLIDDDDDEDDFEPAHKLARMDASLDDDVVFPSL